MQLKVIMGHNEHLADPPMAERLRAALHAVTMAVVGLPVTVEVEREPVLPLNRDLTPEEYLESTKRNLNVLRATMPRGMTWAEAVEKVLIGHQVALEGLVEDIKALDAEQHRQHVMKEAMLPSHLRTLQPHRQPIG